MASSTGEQHGSKFHSKRKRKKSFLQNARGMGKKGKFGHGTQVDQDTYDYFVRVLELLKGEFDSPHDKDALVANALEQTEGNEVDYSSNQVGARLIENLINLAPSHSLVRFMDAFANNLRVIVTNRFASHVLQALVATVTKRGMDKAEGKEESDNSESKDELTSEACFDWVLKVAKFTLNNLEEFIWDEYANHVMRTILACLGGSPPCNLDSTTWNSSKNIQSVFTSKTMKTEDDSEVTPEVQDVPLEFKKTLKEFYERISAWPQFIDLANSNITSAFLQTLLSVLSKSQPKLKKKLIKHLIDQVFSKRSEENDTKDLKEESSPNTLAFNSDASIRLLEATLELASSKHVTQMYAMCFKGHIVELACDRSTNFSVQRLLHSCDDKTEFETLFEELAPGLDRVLSVGHSGVVLALCQACKRLSSQQGPFVENLMKALDCWKPAERRQLITPLSAQLCSYEKYQAQQSTENPSEVTAKDGVVKSKFSIHGSLIVQTMLAFHRPIKIVNSLLEMPGSKLKELMCDTKGCHIMDAFVTSEFVGEKSRERLLHRLLGSYVGLACSKHGSRALEALFNVSVPKNQIKIMEELSGREALISNTMAGKIIASKWSLDVFKRSRADWQALQQRKGRTKDMFSDIIGKQSV